MNSKIIFFGLLYSTLISSAFSQKPPLDFDIDYQILNTNNRASAVILMEIHNPSHETIYMWLEGWRIENASVMGENIFLKQPLFSGAISNTLYFYDQRLTKNSSLSTATDNFSSNSDSTCCFIKKVPPKGHFQISILTADDDILKLLKNVPKDEIRILYYYAFATEMPKNRKQSLESDRMAPFMPFNFMSIQFEKDSLGYKHLIPIPRNRNIPYVDPFDFAGEQIPGRVILSCE
ncbi:MAG: hypothetical protein AAFW00_28225 [Bacteroidota bacterium]